MAPGVPVELGEDPIAVPLVEGPGLEVVGVEQHLAAAAGDSLGLGGLQQPGADTLPAQILGHPEQRHLQHAAPGLADEAGPQPLRPSDEDADRREVVRAQELVAELDQSFAHGLLVGRRRNIRDLYRQTVHLPAIPLARRPYLPQGPIRRNGLGGAAARDCPR